MSATKDFSNTRTFLIDLTRCTGCRACQVACKQWNQMKAEKTTFFKGEGYQNPQTMSEYTLTAIHFRDYEKNGENEFAFYKEMCMHCNDPACVSVCPVSAFTKTPEGPVVYDTTRCIGCRFCMIACPFGVPKYEWSKALPLVVKCTGCYARVKEGLIPACAKACPTAITYGGRNDMIEEAKKRLAKWPDKYVNRIYGLDEAGGTSVLYLSALPFTELGFKGVTKRPLPSYTWAALRLVPGVFLTMGGSLAFISWLTHRKDRLRKEEEARKASKTQ
ncbi:MAG: Formate dehydrogenase, nitrate-inducible, iron-sulfur subunit [Syntrophorhabdus sp. PtaB.Bin006]|nr:MAG: Formate dehydrogenase, nitrate-inducible, iron-sulfur subunit [Syntrophorhabdus sp. PtaB.Bin006]